MKATELRAKILASATPKPAPVETKAWGTVYVRMMTVADVDGQNVSDPTDKAQIARSVCRVLCDESGELLFDVRNPEDVLLVSSLSWVEISKIADKATELVSAPIEEGNA